MDDDRVIRGLVVVGNAIPRIVAVAHRILPLGGYAGEGHRRVRRIIWAVLIGLLLMGMAGLGAWQLPGSDRSLKN